MDIKIERHVTDKKEKEMIQERKKTIRAKGTKREQYITYKIQESKDERYSTRANKRIGVYWQKVNLQVCKEQRTVQYI